MVNPKYYKYTMPRLSLFRPNRTRDYQFLDRTIVKCTLWAAWTSMFTNTWDHKPGADSALSGNFDATQPTYEEWMC
jgi:hypothetical protein